MEIKKVTLPKIILIASIMSVFIVAFQIVGAFTIELEAISIGLALVPLILGAIWCGPKVGAILGAIFSITVLCLPSSWTFLKIDPAPTVVVALAKGILAGYLTGYVYQLLTRINKLFASVIAAVVCPLVNTLVFMLGCVVFFTDNLYVLSSGQTEGLLKGVSWFWSCVSSNFIFEFAYCVIATPIIALIVDSIRHSIKKKHMKNKRHTHHRRPHYPTHSSHE